jgi:RimJ/RimL family protein N-acetyltransferase
MRGVTTEQPTLKTPRLVLRPFVPRDLPALHRLASAKEIAATTLRIPHPYSVEEAAIWIESHEGLFESGKGAVFAVVEAVGGVLCGCAGLGCNLANSSAELGYWIGLPFWNRGYATEAAQSVLIFGFACFRLHRIHASHFGSNPASGRVMEKIGMRYEGRRREHVYKEGRGFEDSVDYGLLAADLARHSTLFPTLKSAAHA